jgi:hypothetical protein
MIMQYTTRMKRKPLYAHIHPQEKQTRHSRKLAACLRITLFAAHYPLGAPLQMNADDFVYKLLWWKR